MTARNIRLPIAALLLTAGSATLASDWQWREQVDTEALNAVTPMVSSGESLSRADSLWREQVDASAYQGGDMEGPVKMTGRRAPDLWLWREQIDLGTDIRIIELRVSGLEAADGGRE